MCWMRESKRTTIYGCLSLQSIMANSLPSILWSGDMACLPSRDNSLKRSPPSFPLFSLSLSFWALSGSSISSFPFKRFLVSRPNGCLILRFPSCQNHHAFAVGTCQATSFLIQLIGCAQNRRICYFCYQFGHIQWRCPLREGLMAWVWYIQLHTLSARILIFLDDRDAWQ